MDVDIRAGLRSAVVRFATTHIKAAGRICRRYFSVIAAQGAADSAAVLDIAYKGDGSPVTAADKAVERYLTRAIRRKFPTHEIVGEEYAAAEPTADAAAAGTADRYRWYIDPIDGTYAFIHGIPLYSCLLALCRNGAPIMGMIYNPQSDELAVAIAGGGCYINGRPAAVRSCAAPSDALLLCSDVSLLLQAIPPATRDLLVRCAHTRTWCDAYGYLLLVSGRADAVVDVGMKPWDIAPLYVIVREAGGVISALDGSDAPLGDSCIAAAADLHPQLVAHFE